MSSREMAATVAVALIGLVVIGAGAVIWLGIGVAVTAWLIGLLVEIGPLVHLLLLAAAGLLVLQVRRDRGAAES
jgi:hypothetical protein